VFSRFFIDRPIFASVLSIFVLLLGGIAVGRLPIAQYPEITPPTVEVSAIYPGANARVVADTVAAPIEQQVNGVENMLHMSSTCTNDGTYTLTVTFEHGIDLNMAQVLVQNRVSLAQPILPELVQRRGVAVKKKSPSVLMIINLFSPDGSRDNLYLSNYATIQLKDELSRLKGVGDITYLGQRDYSMRIWLDPGKMAANNLTSSDVVLAIGQQNTQVAAGSIGQPPVPPGQVYQYTMSTMGRLTEPEQFAGIILKTEAEGKLVFLRDVVRPNGKDPSKVEKETGTVEGIELGAQGYDQTCTFNGRPSVALSVYQLPGSNALATAQRVRDHMRSLERSQPATAADEDSEGGLGNGSFLPPGVDYRIVYDTTPFINESIKEVFKTLRDAVILVALVVLLFLQSWRSAIIPLIAVPVAIIGTFAAMQVAGFSLNNLTLFGLVLAIGIVVDDAIVVVEAVEHHIEHGLAPREATIRAMEQVSGPVVAVGLVLTAVFIPCTFIAGLTGQFFRQFALTIAVSTLISAFNSLTLSPALTALLLRPQDRGVAMPLPWWAFPLLGAWIGWEYLSAPLQPMAERAAALLPGLRLQARAPQGAQVAAGLVGALGLLIVSLPLNYILRWAFRTFNRGFDLATNVYTRMVGVSLRLSLLVLLIYAGLLGLTWWSFTSTPTGFIPQQDKGYLLVNVQLPDAAAVGRTQAVMKRIEELALETEGVKDTVAIAGQSLLLGANAPNFGSMYVMLADFHKRKQGGLSGDEIAAALQSKFRREILDGLINVFAAPPVEGLGTAGGFKIIIEDRGGLGLDTLEKVADRMVAAGNDQHEREIEGLFTSFRANTPWLYLDIDRVQAKSFGVPMSEVFNTLQVYMGSLYVNDFNRFGRTWQVNVQADAAFRRQVEDLRRLKIRSDRGRMVPLAAIATIRPISGPVLIQRYNMYYAAAINGNPQPGISSGQAIRRMQEVASREQLHSMRHEWTELALLQLQTGNTAMWVFLLAVVLVFLVLAAQYESWSLPLAVILVVPMCLLCSIVGVILAEMDVNIFTQIGFVVLVGLACKNAILIVEFAKAQHERGVPRYEATLAACKLRLRPIMMTSLAFILGVVPLVIAEGAGAEMRRTLGTAVFSGMLGVTLFGIFLTPVFYYVIQWVSDRRLGRLEPAAPHTPPPPSPPPPAAGPSQPTGVFPAH
jgi:multidrug efflux pump subunit AcrB